MLTALTAPQYIEYGVVGASGATSGVLGAYLVRLSWSRIRIAYWVFMPLQGVNRTGRAFVPAVFAVLVWFGLQTVRAVVQFGTGGAHIAYGEQWMNMAQPFWALPALAIAGLGVRDIMGYCITALLFSGVIFVIGLTLF